MSSARWTNGFLEGRVWEAVCLPGIKEPLYSFMWGRLGDGNVSFSKISMTVFWSRREENWGRHTFNIWRYWFCLDGLDQCKDV